jgi:hypothetical protein
VSPARYRNSPVRLELVSDHAPDIVLQFYDTYTDSDGNLTRLLTEPSLELTAGQYWLNVLIPYLVEHKGVRDTRWHFVSRLPVTLLEDAPEAATLHRAVISDIDGTVYYTAYQTFLEMLSTAYTKPSGKVFIEGMPLLLRTLAERPNTTLHGISCSPENLRDFIRETTAREGFQFDTLRLNKSFTATRSRERILYKVTRCLELLEELPKHSQLLFLGDNKEQDIDTYELVTQLLTLPKSDTRAQVTQWVAQVIDTANRVRPGSVPLTQAPFVRTRLESLALNVLGREHESPDVFILESHQPHPSYAQNIRARAQLQLTQFCQNGHGILDYLLQNKKQHHDIRRLDFLLRNTREPQLLTHLEQPS